ncbi:MAG TPA: PLP-dependent aminotransferase family protein [Savagea sp.]
MEFLFIELNKKSTTPLYEQIYEKIKREIISKRISPSTKLPSKRKLADFLQVSQTTIELAYNQLIDEGYIDSIPRKGFYVEEIDELLLPVQPAEIKPSTTTFTHNYSLDFSPGAIDTEHFPFSTWKRYTKDIVSKEHADLLQLGHPHGDLELRNEIAQYVYQSRGVVCSPEQIIIGSGTEQLIPLIIEILGKQVIFGIENPGYLISHPIFINGRQPMKEIDVDQEGIKVEQLQEQEVDIAFVTPSHQFPTGTVMSASRRVHLLNWASEKNNRYIIEDDYDSEFRYSGKPIPALKSLDQQDKVIYLSTFSKSFIPSLRIAYMVLPDPLLKTYAEAFIHYSATVPRFDQQVVANFMKDGHFSKHLNRMRNVYRRKFDLVTATLKEYRERISYSGERAGMHLILTFNSLYTEEELMNKAKNNGIQIFPLSRYQKNEESTSSHQFILGFGNIPLEKIPTAIHRLFDTWDLKKPVN